MGSETKEVRVRPRWRVEGKKLNKRVSEAGRWQGMGRWRRGTGAWCVIIKGGKGCSSKKLTMSGKLYLTHHEPKTRAHRHDASSRGSSLYVNGLKNLIWE